MGGGGKGSSAPPVEKTYIDPVNGKSFTDGSFADKMKPDYKTGAQLLNEEIAARQADEKATSDTTKATKDATDAQARTDFNTRAATAKQSAFDNIVAYFRKQGIEPTNYVDDINRTVDTASQGVSDLDPNPAGKYAATLGSDLYNQVQSGRQSQALAGYNSTFAPDYSQRLVGDDLVGKTVQDIVSRQLDPLTGQLDNARKRGTLNDTGYQAALKALGDARTSATSTVTGLANNVLAKDRGDLDTYIGTGRTAAGSVPLGSTFDPATYVSGAQTRADQFRNSFGGDVSNAVGSTKFTDLTSLLNAGGAQQGATDPTATNPMGAVGPDGKPIGGGDLSPAFLAEQALKNDKRGLGSTGAF